MSLRSVLVPLALFLSLVRVSLGGVPCERVEPGDTRDCDGNGFSDDCDLEPRALGFEGSLIDEARSFYWAHTVFDVDGDGDLDIVVQANGLLRAYRDRGNRTFDRPVFSPSSGGNDGLRGVDIDSDGATDLVSWFSGVSFSFISLQAGTGDGAFGVPEDLDAPNLTFVLAGDVTGDGLTDLLSFHFLGANALLRAGRDGFQFDSPHEVVLPGTSISRAALSDLDGDGDLDLAIVRSEANEVSTWMNDGSGAFTLAESFLVEGEGFLRDVVVANFDGEGEPEIAFLTQTEDFGGTLFVASRDVASGNYTPAPVFTSDTSLEYLAAIDFDGDGDPDLVSADRSRVFIHENVTLPPGESLRIEFAPSGQSPGAFRSVQSVAVGAEHEGKRGLVVVAGLPSDCGQEQSIVLLAPRREARATDCDGDGVVDACEEDRDGDGIPDDCQLPDSLECASPGGGFTPDCNANGVGDACDVERGTSPDADGDGVPDECQTELIAFTVTGPSVIRGAPGGVVERDYFVTLVPGDGARENDPGVTGWSVSLRAQGLEVLGVSPVGTVSADVCDDPPGLRSGGFYIGEPVRERDGMVGATVLSFEHRTLPAGRGSHAFRVTVRARLPVEPADEEARFVFEDGLQGSGTPLSNTVAVVRGSLVSPTVFNLRVVVSSLPSAFRRGDANGDGRYDISDGIHTLTNLFLGGPRGGCRDAADFDDSGQVDISDAIATFQNLFLGGPRPAAPGIFRCAEDPTADQLGCDEFRGCPRTGE